MRKNKYWLCITDLSNWDVIKKNYIYGVTQMHKKFLDQIKPADRIIMYVVPKKIGGFFLAGKGKPTEKNVFTGGEFPFRIKLNPKYIPKDFLELNFKIIKNMKLFELSSWGPRLMGRSIINIEKEDYEYLYKLAKEEDY